MSIYSNLYPELICSVLSFLPGTPDLQLSPRQAIRPLYITACNKKKHKLVIEHLDVLFNKHKIQAIKTPTNPWAERCLHFHRQAILCLYMMFPPSPLLSPKLDDWLINIFL